MKTKGVEKSVRRCGRGADVIPIDVIPKILSNLPLKSLCRFKCVSKAWRSFILTNFHESQRHPIFVRLSDLFSNGLSIYSIDANGFTNHVCTSEAPPGFSFPKYCTGLFYDLGYESSLAVCNPSRREQLILPNYNGFDCGEPNWFDLGFDPFELGFDPLSGKYKMLNLINYPDCEIFTIGSTSWIPLHSDGVEVLRACGLPSTHSICICGTLYLYCEATNKIISFQIGSESIKAIQGPKRVAPRCGESVVMFLFELEGCLCLADCFSKFNVLDLWMMKDGCNSNNVDCTWVRLKTLIPPSKDIAWIHPYSIRAGEIVIAKENYPRRILYLYSFLTQRFCRIKVIGLHSNFVVEDYVENPISLRDL